MLPNFVGFTLNQLNMFYIICTINVPFGTENKSTTILKPYRVWLFCVYLVLCIATVDHFYL